MKALRTLVGPPLILAIFVSSLWLLHSELKQYHFHDFVDGLSNIPIGHLILAIGLTILGYAALIGYDWVAVAYLGYPLGLPRIALASLLSYAVGNSFGMLLGGSTIRYRLYAEWGLSAVEIVKLVMMASVTFWIGVFTLSGFVFLVTPIEVPARLHLPMATTRPLGLALAAPALGYLLLCIFRRRPVRIGKWEFSLPSWTWSLQQYVVAVLDLTIVACVLYVLLPSSLDVGFSRFLATFMLGLIASLITQVPGGLGVFELSILTLLDPPEPQLVIGSLLAFRLIYYLLPLAISLLVLGVNEMSMWREPTEKAMGAMGRWIPVVAPRLLAVTLFVSGVVLLFSGATPATHGRMQMLAKLLPLALVELSHFLASVAGVVLLLLARGLQRRVDTAYLLAIPTLIVGIVMTLLKGFDYEEAVILVVMLAILLPSRSFFYRRGALLTERFTAPWMIAILFVLACTVWLMLFAYRHVEYRDELWWRFAFDQHAPRSLRALVGAVLVVFTYTTAWLLQPKGRPPALPTADELASARVIVERSSLTSAYLALLGDKRLLFNADRTAMIMYGVEGRSWVSMGDPVGDEAAVTALAWEFRELCDESGGWPVFYQVSQDCLARYVDMGLSLIKLGEEARVPLSDFGLEVASRRGLRRTNKRLTEEGWVLDVVPPEQVPPLLPQLKRISDAWLAEKNTAEKGFSLGFFRPEYIQRCPVALIRRQGTMVALANLWQGADRQELSADLMRYVPDSPPGMMEFLFIQLMLWGRQQGYQWFNLGMAPLSGLEAQRLAPLWNHIASFAYRHGEHFYNFQGLRQYKDKFDPVWSPKYLASPGGWALPTILANIATLISGGLQELVRK